MGNNLTNQYISASFQGLVQISGSQLTDGTGSLIDSLNITASNAVTATSAINSATATSASYASTATSASHSLTSNVSTFAATATSASYAVTASFALNAGGAVDTGSLLVTASAVDATTTYTKGNGSTFNVTVNNVSSSISASHSLTANVATFAATATSASYALKSEEATYATSSATAATATSASHSLKADEATYATSSATSATATSASYALKADEATYATSSATADTATSASYSLKAGEATYATSSATADTAESASYAITASFALNVVPQNTGSLLVTASVVDATTTYTKGDGSTFNTTIDNVNTAVSASYAGTASYASDFNVATSLTASGLIYPTTDGTTDQVLKTDGAGNLSFGTVSAAAFPFTGSAQITGSLGVTGSVRFQEAIVDTIDPTIGTNVGGLILNTNLTASANGATIDNNTNVLVGGIRNDAPAGLDYGSWISSSSDSLVYGVAHQQYGPGIVQNVTGSVVLAAGLNNGGSGQGFQVGDIGSQGNVVGSAFIASNGDMKYGMENCGMFGVYTGYLYGAANPAQGVTLVGGRQNTINRGSWCNIYGGFSNSIPNAYTDNNAIVNGQSNSITGGSRNTIIGGDQQTISNGSNNMSINSVSTSMTSNSPNNIAIATRNSSFTGTNANGYNVIMNSNGAQLQGSSTNYTSIISCDGGLIGGTATNANSVIAGQGLQITAGQHSFLCSSGTAVVSSKGKAFVAASANATISGGTKTDVSAQMATLSSTITSGGSGTQTLANVILAGNGQLIQNGNYNAVIGGTSNKIGVSTINCTSNGILGGTSNTVNHNRSVILGGNAQTTTKDDEVLLPNLTITSTTGVQQLIIANYANLAFADDTAAAAGGVPLGGVYQASGALRIRIV